MSGVYCNTVLQGDEHFVDGTAENVARLIADRVLHEREYNLVCLACLLRAWFVNAQILVLGEQVSATTQIF